MIDSKRLTALKRLCQHLSDDITVANGYQHTLTGRVFRGRMDFSADEPVPALSVLETLNPDRDAREASADRSKQVEKKWNVLVQGWAEDDRLNPTDPAHHLMADVKKSLAKIIRPQRPQLPVFLLGNLILGMTIEPGIVRPPEAGLSSRAYFFLRVTIEFFEDVSDPYRLT